MTTKILKFLAILFIVLFFLSLYGWTVSKVVDGSKQFGFLTAPIQHLYQFPDLFAQTVDEVKTPPRTFRPTPVGFNPVNKLDEDILVLSTYTDEDNTRTIALLNLKTDSQLYKWKLNASFKPHNRILNPLLLPGKSLIYAVNRSGVKRIDSLGNILWRQDSIKQHHSINLDAEGKIWICSYEYGVKDIGHYKLNGQKVFFHDNFITQLDDETGRILFHKSVAEILVENHLSYLLVKSPVIRDPFHTNDVEPALKTTAFFNKGDLFLSLRSQSAIVHYRPSTNQLINLIEGPFVSQHDVDILNDSTLVLFNNNSFTLRQQEFFKPVEKNITAGISGDFYSNIVSYNLVDGHFTIIGEDVFRENQIFSHSESLVQYIAPDTYFIEEQNSGVLWVISNNEVVYKNVLKSHREGYHHLPNWTRIVGDYTETK